MNGSTNAETMTTDTQTALASKGIINSVKQNDGTFTAVSGTLTDMATTTADSAGTYLITARWDMSTNPNTSQTYSAQFKIGGAYVNLFAGHYGTDTYARGTICYVTALAAGTSVSFALYQALGSNQSCYSQISLVKLA